MPYTSKLQNLFLILCIFLFPLQSVSARTINVATIDYEPFSSPRLKEGGFQTAIIRAVLHAMGHKAVFTFYPWKRAFAMTKRGDSDFVTSIYFTHERNKIFHFSEPLYNSEVGLVGLKSLGTDRYTNLADLKSYNIGVLAGAVFQDEFDNADYLQKIAINSDEQTVDMLYRGRLDLVATSLINFQFKVIQSKKYDPNKLVFLRPLLAVRPVFVAVSRVVPDHETLISDFNEGLAKIKSSGVFDKIVEDFGISHLRGESVP